MVFVWGPPQPTLIPGVSLGLENGTPIDDSGKSVAAYNREVEKRRKTYTCMSRSGLILIMMGFGLQLWAVWLPPKPIKKVDVADPTQVSKEFKAERNKTSQDSDQ